MLFGTLVKVLAAVVVVVVEWLDADFVADVISDALARMIGANVLLAHCSTIGINQTRKQLKCRTIATIITLMVGMV